MTPVHVGTKVGYGDDTKLKLIDFERLVDWHTNICENMRVWAYVYLDANAGCGYHPGDSSRDGSAVIAAQAMAKNLTRHWHMYAVDRTPLNAERILERLRLRGMATANITVAEGDNRALIPEWLEEAGNPYGLLFHDPNEVPDWDLLEAAFAGRPKSRIDVLIYMSGTRYKRRRTVVGEPPLVERLTHVAKKYWLVRRPTSKFQSSFLLGTNWRDFPQWQKRGFHRAETPIGQDILFRLSATRQERFDKTHPKLPLFEGSDIPAYRTYPEYLEHPRFLAVREQVMARAKGICEYCGIRPATEPHHLTYPALGTFDVPENMIAVCHECHCEIEGKVS